MGWTVCIGGSQTRPRSPDDDKKKSQYLKQGTLFLGQVLDSRKRDSTDFQTSVIRRRGGL